MHIVLSKAAVLRHVPVLPKAMVATFALIVTAGTIGLSATGAAASGAAAIRTDMAGAGGVVTMAAVGSRDSAYRPRVTATGAIPQPPWWHGQCDGAASGAYPGSHPLGASWDGLVACGPGPNEGGYDHPVDFFNGAWGENEWECVELAMRWMYLAWGVPPYAANGDTVADNYATYNPHGPKVQLIRNGTKGSAPQPGDVLELQIDGPDTPGHTEVVTASNVNGQGNGSVQVMTENLDSPTNGWYTLSVSNWVVNGEFGTVVDWLHNPAWSLEEPLVAEVDSSGVLGVKVDELRGGFSDVASKVAQALVVGGGGSEPSPVEVVLTTSGTLEARYALPDAPWRMLASSGVRQIAAASGEGRGNSEPEIGWLTNSGAFELQSHGLSSAPALEASSATDIAIGSDSPSDDAVIGYVSNHEAYVKVGDGSWQRVASRVRTISLAADSRNADEPIIGYVSTSGRAFVRQGLIGSFTEVGPNASNAVKQIAVAAVGTGAEPLVAYVTTTGAAYASLGTSAAVEEATSGAAQVEVAGAENRHGFPILAIQSGDGSWVARDGSLTADPVSEGTATGLSLSTLVVS